MDVVCGTLFGMAFNGVATMEKRKVLLTKEDLRAALLEVEKRIDALWGLKLDAELERLASKEDIQPYFAADASETAQDESWSATDKTIAYIARSEIERREFREFFEAEPQPIKELESVRKLAERVHEHLEDCRRFGIC
jgi:hypothetical protein